MKKFIGISIIAVNLFSASSTLAFDWENSVFKPLMIYSVYEDVIPDYQNVIPDPQNVIPDPQNVIPDPQNVIPDPDPGSQETQQETKQPAQILNQVQNDNSNVIPTEEPVIPTEEPVIPTEEPVIPTEVEESLYNRQLPFTVFEFLLSKVKKYAKDYIDDIIYKASWKLPESPDVITDEYIESLEDWQREKLHYGRNIYQTDIPLRVEDLDPDEWEKYGEAVAHNLAGATGNVDYRGIGARAGQQAIYDKNGDLVVTPENMGTFDYYPPLTKIKAVKHCKTDVADWLALGNSPEDTTTQEDRVNALLNDTPGRLCLWHIGHISTIEMLTK